MLALSKFFVINPFLAPNPQNNRALVIVSWGIEREHWLEMSCDGAAAQKQPSRGVLRKRCSENMQQIYMRTPMPKCDFNKVALQLY